MLKNLGKVNFSKLGFIYPWIMKIGYARVSTVDQNLHLQKDALANAGCEKIIVDTISGSVVLRPGLEKVKEQLREGDSLVVWRLDRLGRSLKDLINWSGYLEERGIGLVSLQESIDTSSSTGKLVFHMFGALAEFERNLIRERTMAGLQAARSRGKMGGRPKALTKDKQKLLMQLYKDDNISVKEICQMMNISKPTLYKYVKTSKIH
ncbi:DNA invertase Pin-like site-specific DNA recombinase [Catalinimonas alkaloidigena]|nr:DNA invertase Pin-like site-specific DNA recombinase [Catalinimonas alkaloidigena]